VSLFCDISIDFTGDIDGEPASGTITLFNVGITTAGLANDGTVDIAMDGGYVGGEMTVDVTSVVSGLIHSGSATI